MPPTSRGLYEVLITEALDAGLQDDQKSREIRREGLRDADAADRIAFHLGRVVERAVTSFGREERVDNPLP